ncbi:hypothetical protein DM02DRAFT_640189 [Periconia macrospinosa]|uniref:Rhodopsin domain-containing protein n=1 Tax=Periconia macrospinosa TaxID=97972 RepID=A0A2V1E0V6_9PLEO|nr:hypothetical protein DM02DRAFT_640189 [Periconia macrospinosa]
MPLDQNPRGRQAIVVTSAFNALALLVGLLRIYTRVFIVRYFGVEDGFTAFVLICSVGLTVTIAIQAKYGLGEHISQLSLPTIENSLKAFYASLIIYNLSLGLIKLSLLFQYKRIFPTKRFQIACWIVMGIVSAHATWAVFGSVFACFPVDAFWLKTKEATCLNQRAMWFTNAAINIFTDLVIIILPMPVVRSLNLEKRQKQALIAIFAIGGV